MVVLVLIGGGNSEDGAGGVLFNVLAIGLWHPSAICFVPLFRNPTKPLGEVIWSLGIWCH